MYNQVKNKPTQLQGYRFIGVAFVFGQFLFHGIYS